MGGFFEVTGRIYPMACVSQATQHHRLQHGIVFNQQNSHGVGIKRTKSGIGQS
jgi:hypothetical protein